MHLLYRLGKVLIFSIGKFHTRTTPNIKAAGRAQKNAIGKPFCRKFVNISVNHQNIKDMLIIEISSDGRPALIFSELEGHNIPAPPDGFDSEINNNIVMRFDDEQQAIDYSYDLDSYANTLDNKSPEYQITTRIIKAISEDDFVRSYIDS